MNTPATRSLITALTGIVLVSVAQLAMKWGMQGLGFRQLAETSPYDAVVYFWPQLTAVTLGVCCYGLSMFLWILTLKHMPLSLAYPLLSVSYILVWLGSVSLPWFHDSFSLIKLAGIASIIVGLLLIFSAKTDQS